MIILAKRPFNTTIAFLLCMVLQIGSASPQATVTGSALGRVLMIRNNNTVGTAFALDVDGREYWITAKHILTGAKHPPYGSIQQKTATLSLRNPGGNEDEWLPVEFTVIDPGDNIDIVVLGAPQPVLKAPLPSIPTSSDGVMIGEDCEFVGFPFAAGWHGEFQNKQTFLLPFAKRCTVSGHAAVEGVWFLDGINNNGFSGGPVVFRTGPQQRILGVISGYFSEPAEVLSLEPEPHTKEPKVGVNVNAGFFLAYDIVHAINAIQKNPVGPLREAK